MQTLFLVALTIGVFSTLHCVGMCGGIISALSFGLPASVRERWELMVLYAFFYNLGRIISYTLAGALLGVIGQQVFAQVSPHYGHLVLQALAAIIMIAIGLYLAGWWPQFAYIERIGTPIWRHLEPLRKKIMPVQSLPQALAFGLIWGWLPCGLVYSMLIASAAQGSALGGAVYMLGFGVGTLLPLMLVGLFAGQVIQFIRHPYIRKIVGLSLITFALIMVFGLDWHPSHHLGELCHDV